MLVWKTLSAAMLPLRLEHLPRLLPQIVDHLLRYDPHRNRESAIERCLRRWQDELPEAPE